jgi:hypothetical protein
MVRKNMRKMHLFRCYTLIAALGVLVTAGVPAFGEDLSNATIPELIDRLTQVDAQSLWIDSYATYSGFIAEDTPPRVSPVMRELVRRGPEALPALVAHIGDQRPTKLEVGNAAATPSKGKPEPTSHVMWIQFSDEYDPRANEHPRVSLRPPSGEMLFEGNYTVRVGDICFVLIGQIVNRRLFVVDIDYLPRYGVLIVNSPVRTPTLADRVKADWGPVDVEGLKQSLLSDLHWADSVKVPSSHSMPNLRYDPAAVVAYGALRRLRLYFPGTYKTLAGNDLKRKKEFEREEAAAKSGNKPQ